MNVGDKVVWINVKRFGNKTELSKMSGVIVAIDGDKATVEGIGYNSKTAVVSLDRLRLESQDTPMSLLEYARQNFGIGASQSEA